MPGPADKKNYVRVKDRVPRSGRGADSLLDQLKLYLSQEENKFSQLIVVDATKAYIYVEKLVHPDKAPDLAETTWHDALRNMPMQEMNPAEGFTHEYFLKVFSIINRNGLEVCQILLHPETKMFALLNLSPKSKHIYGVPVTLTGEIPEDAVITCAARSRIAEPDDIEFSMKGALP